MREAGEESGLTDLFFFHPGIIDVDIHPIPAGRGEPDHQHFDVRYLLATRDAEAIRQDPAESLDLGWFELDEAASKMKEQGSLRVIEKIRRILLP